MKNISMIRADTEELFSDDHLQAILAHFRGSGNPPNLFFQSHTWILYIYALICVHGLIMNTFLVNLKKFELIVLFLKISLICIYKDFTKRFLHNFLGMACKQSIRFCSIHQDILFNGVSFSNHSLWVFATLEIGSFSLWLGSSLVDTLN